MKGENKVTEEEFFTEENFKKLYEVNGPLTVYYSKETNYTVRFEQEKVTGKHYVVEISSGGELDVYRNFDSWWCTHEIEDEPIIIGAEGKQLWPIKKDEKELTFMDVCDSWNRRVVFRPDQENRVGCEVYVCSIGFNLHGERFAVFQNLKMPGNKPYVITEKNFDDVSWLFKDCEVLYTAEYNAIKNIEKYTERKK